VPSFVQGDTTSVGEAFNFIYTCWFCLFKISEQRTTGSGYFRNLKELVVLVNKLAKDSMVLWVIKNHGYMSKPII
jgi:hypothetical protein